MGDHVLHDHHMWTYARFLLYLSEAKESDMNGPESYVMGCIANQEYTSFYPVDRALALDAGDDDEYAERQLRVKDLEELRSVMKECEAGTERILGSNFELKTRMKESKDSLKDLQMKLANLQGYVSKAQEQLAKRQTKPS